MRCASDCAVLPVSSAMPPARLFYSAQKCGARFPRFATRFHFRAGMVKEGVSRVPARLM
jgi:hypothetical protein